MAESKDFEHEYGVPLNSSIGKNYDAVIVAVNHEEYKDLDEAYFQSITHKDALLVDIKGTYRERIKTMKYWSL
jgi:UDP-N-acetyl-D-galactosamine dehydrogenase